MEFREKNDSNSISDRFSDIDIGNAISVLFGLIVVGSIIVLVVLAVYAYAGLKYKSFVSKDGVSIDFYVASDSLDNAELVDYDYLTGNATFKTALGDNANIKSDLLPGVSDDIKLDFIKYCYANKIHNKIEVLGYSDNNKMLSYKDLFDEAIITLTLGNNGFYQSGFESLKPYRYGVYHSLN